MPFPPLSSGRFARPSRRRFVQGLVATGVVSAFPGPRGWAAPVPLARTAPVLEGDRFDLTLDALSVNVTGRGRTATVINGSMPGPALRMREGSMVTINVLNRLSEPSSLHWHGLYLPASMDGVPEIGRAHV